MVNKLRVLIVEDSEDDAILLLRELQRGGYQVEHTRVETAADMKAALANQEWDLIFSDFSMPHFSATGALTVLKESGLDLPFLIISGTIGEETAVAALQAGAHDFMLKHKTARLIPAVERNLREAQERQKRREAEAICRIALEFILAQLSVGEASITVFDLETQKGAVYASYSRYSPIASPGTRFSLAAFPTEEIEALRKGEIREIGDISTLLPVPPDSADRDASGLPSYIAIPLVAQGQLIGSINLGADRPDAFSADQLDTVREIADQLAVAIQQARYRAQIQRHAAELEERVILRTAELQNTKDRLEAILNNSSDAIVLTTSSGTIQQVNRTFGALFDYPTDAVFGRSLLLLASPEDQPVLRDSIYRCLETGHPSQIEITAQRRDASPFDAEIALAPVFEQQTIQSLVCSLRDITERKRAERELRRAFEQEKELNELKSRISSMISHEFRTPLAVILSSVGLLQQYSDRLTQEKKQDLLEQVRNQVKRLVSLLDEMLSLSRAETVGVQAFVEPLDFVAFCTELVNEIQQTTHLHQLLLTVHGEHRLVALDPKLMRQAITNLLSNAVKYSPEGGTVSLDLVYEAQHLSIRVKDEGIGIPPEDLERLFDLFYRASNVGRIPGTGLGMPIIRQAIEAHGGSITVESAVGVGTTFLVTLPIPSKTDGQADP